MRLHLDPSKWPSGVFGSAAHTASVLDAIRAVMVCVAPLCASRLGFFFAACASDGINSTL